MLIEIQLVQIEGELEGQGIVAARSIINNLETNERVLYARMINIGETTLIA